MKRRNYNIASYQSLGFTPNRKFRLEAPRTIDQNYFDPTPRLPRGDNCDGEAVGL